MVIFNVPSQRFPPGPSQRPLFYPETVASLSQSRNHGFYHTHYNSSWSKEKTWCRITQSPLMQRQAISSDFFMKRYKSSNTFQEPMAIFENEIAIPSPFSYFHSWLQVSLLLWPYFQVMADDVLLQRRSKVVKFASKLVCQIKYKICLHKLSSP